MSAPRWAALALAAGAVAFGLYVTSEPPAQLTVLLDPPLATITFAVDPPAEPLATADEAIAALPPAAPGGEITPPAAPDAAVTPPPVSPPPEAEAPKAEEVPAAPATPTWLAYARPFEPAPDLPLIAVVVVGLGQGQASSNAAIALPGAVTLAFDSSARDLQTWIDRARAAGHEVLLDVPMEPRDYPDVDPGPHPLLTSLSSGENVERLGWHLDRATGYVGVTHNMGSRFTAASDSLRPVLSEIEARGLLYLDARTSSASVGADLAAAIGLPRAVNDRFLDNQASRAAIDRRLAEIESIARSRGHAVAVSHAFPVTLERLDRWIATLPGKRLALAPLSAIAGRRVAP